MTDAEFQEFIIDRDCLNSMHGSAKERLETWTKIKTDSSLAAITRARAVYRIKVWQKLLDHLESKETKP